MPPSSIALDRAVCSRSASANAIGLVFHGGMYAPQPAVMAELFPTRMRSSGVSLGAQVTAISAGSLAPILATPRLRDLGSWLPIAIYIVVACIVTSIGVLSLTETRGISLRDTDAADAPRTTARPATTGAKGAR